MEGFIGVLVGASIPWLQSFISSKLERKRHASYLAIRVVIALREYLYQCWRVTEDDGGERDSGGCLYPQVKQPGPIKYPEDIDWKSIDPKLTYQLLSLPSIAQAADRAISVAGEYDSPPDYEDYFEERYLQYSMMGLKIISLEEELCRLYSIPKEISLEDWDPKSSFQKKIKQVEERQIKRAESNKKIFEEFENSSKAKKP